MGVWIELTIKVICLLFISGAAIYTIVSMVVETYGQPIKSRQLRHHCNNCSNQECVIIHRRHDDIGELMLLRCRACKSQFWFHKNNIEE